MDRRAFLRGVILVAPAVILTPGLLMPVRSLWTPKRGIETWAHGDILTATEIHAREVQWAIQFGRMLTPPDRLWFSLAAVINEHELKK